MNPITDIWRQLVRRRLWPVAILLVGAVAAVPVLLAKDPEPAPPAPPIAASDDGGVLTAEPIVAEIATADPDKGRRPLGDKHDPFKPTKKAVKVKQADDASEKPDAATEPKTEAPADPPSTGGSTPAPTPEPPVTEDEPEKPKTYPAGSLLVRLSGADDAGAKVHVDERKALPSNEAPLLIYLGLADDDKTAVFMVDASIQAVGDGECHPTPENCETVRMRAGDTMFFDAFASDGSESGIQFQLDLLKVYGSKKKASEARRTASRTVRAASASAVGLVGPALSSLGAVGRTG